MRIRAALLALVLVPVGVAADTLVKLKQPLPLRSVRPASQCACCLFRTGNRKSKLARRLRWR